MLFASTKKPSKRIEQRWNRTERDSLMASKAFALAESLWCPSSWVGLELKIDSAPGFYACARAHASKSTVTSSWYVRLQIRVLRQGYRVAARGAARACERGSCAPMGRHPYKTNFRHIIITLRARLMDPLIFHAAYQSRYWLPFFISCVGMYFHVCLLWYKSLNLMWLVYQFGAKFRTCIIKEKWYVV